MTIEIISATEAVIDGKQVMISDAIEHDPASAGAVIKALLRWHEACETRVKELETMLEGLPGIRADLVRVSAERERATADRDAANAIAEANQRDNGNLRQSLANYMLSTDGGQAALKEFRLLALSASIAAQQAELAKMVG